jgi:hypothetical protein
MLPTTLPHLTAQGTILGAFQYPDAGTTRRPGIIRKPHRHPFIFTELLMF